LNVLGQGLDTGEGLLHVVVQIVHCTKVGGKWRLGTKKALIRATSWESSWGTNLVVQEKN
jgi:hypothetical protein